MKELPKSYLEPAKHQGTLVNFDYSTLHYAGLGEKLEKYARVYLPYGYDQTDRDTKYEVFYIIHGYGSDGESTFGYDNAPTSMKHIIDHMIENGDIPPMIFVTPTYYPKNRPLTMKKTMDEVENVHEELMNDLIPALETHYNTYTEGSDPESCKASRIHRGIGGFSMGGCTTWYAFILAADYFSTYLPMSSDCWMMAQYGGRLMTAETVIALTIGIMRFRLKPEDYRVAAYTGSDDVIFDSMDPMMKAMKINAPYYFNDSNIHYEVKEGAVHDGIACGFVAAVRAAFLFSLHPANIQPCF